MCAVRCCPKLVLKAPSNDLPITTRKPHRTGRPILTAARMRMCRTAARNIFCALYRGTPAQRTHPGAQAGNAQMLRSFVTLTERSTSPLAEIGASESLPRLGDGADLKRRRARPRQLCLGNLRAARRFPQTFAAPICAPRRVGAVWRSMGAK